MKNLFLGTICAMSLTSLANAATLASYNYDTGLTASTLASNIASTDTALAGGSARGVSSAGNHVFIRNRTGPLTNGSLSFTISTTGTTDLIDLNTFSFNDPSGAGTTTTYQLFVDGVSAGAAQTPMPAAGSPLYTINLGAFAPASSYNIQLRLSSPGTDTTTNTVRVDNVTIDGALIAAAAPIPEPSSAALFSLGGLALFLRRRK